MFRILSSLNSSCFNLFIYYTSVLGMLILVARSFLQAHYGTKNIGKIHYVLCLFCHFLFQHVFALEGRDELMKHIQDAAANNVGVSVKQRKEPITFEQYQLNRLGKYRYNSSDRICVWRSVFISYSVLCQQFWSIFTVHKNENMFMLTTLDYLDELHGVMNGNF